MFLWNVQWTFLCNTYVIDVPGFQGAEPSGKFRNSPKAGSGAEWLATLRNLPVISPPLSQPLLISFLLHAIPNFDRDDSGFVVQKQTVEEIEKLPFPQIFSSRSGLIMHHSDAKYRTIMCRIRHSILSLHSAHARFPLCLHLSVKSPCYFYFFPLKYLLFLLESIKIAVINISPILTFGNAITAIAFFCYSVFVKLNYTVSSFSCYCHFLIS